MRSLSAQFSLSKLPSHITTAYSQLKQDLLSLNEIPIGSIGTLVEKQCNPQSPKKYLYRAYSNPTGKKVFDLVAAVEQQDKVQKALQDHAFFKEAKTTLKSLAGAGYPMADKSAVELLAGLFNHGLVGATEQTMVLVGTTAYCALLSDLGLKATAIMTRDLDLAVTRDIDLASTESFEKIVKQTMPDFFAVPGMPSHEPSTSLKGRGANAMRIDVLRDGAQLGKALPVRSLAWHAQAIPHLNWLVENPRVCLVLSSVKAVPVRAPDPIRFAFHKAFCATNRSAIDADKSSKDREQSLALLDYLQTNQSEELIEEFELAPQPVQHAVKRLLPNPPDWLEQALPNKHRPKS